jgi:hypothetical protein
LDVAVRIREVSPLLQVRVNLTPMSQELLEEASAPRWASRFFWLQMMKPASVKGNSVHHSAPTDGERQIKTGTHRPEMPLKIGKSPRSWNRPIAFRSEKGVTAESVPSDKKP